MENGIFESVEDARFINEPFEETLNRLSETSSKVFNACDGEQKFVELRAKYQFTDEIIYLALDELKKNNLIESEYISPFIGMSRREIIRKVGFASMIALPIISSLVAPTTAQAASNCSCCVKAGQFVCSTCNRTGLTSFVSYNSTDGSCTAGRAVGAGTVNCSIADASGNSDFCVF